MDQLCTDASQEAQQLREHAAPKSSSTQASSGKTPRVLSKQDSRSVSTEVGSKLNSQLLAAMNNVKFSTACSFCEVHKKMCRVPDTKQYESIGMITMAVAGISCSSAALRAFGSVCELKRSVKFSSLDVE